MPTGMLRMVSFMVTGILEMAYFFRVKKKKKKMYNRFQTGR